MLTTAASASPLAGGISRLMTTRPGRPNVARWIQHKPAAQRERPAMKPADHISVQAYARRCGVGEQAIYRRIERGLLQGALTRQSGRIWIHPARADRAYAMRSLPCNSRAARLQERLILLSDTLPEELHGQSLEYCRAAIARLVDRVLQD